METLDLSSSFFDGLEVLDTPSKAPSGGWIRRHRPRALDPAFDPLVRTDTAVLPPCLAPRTPQTCPWLYDEREGR